MAHRKFELPGIQDLSKEQEAVRALPKEGQHLIVGGPGTGKSVLALVRARRHMRDGDIHVVLVFNHLLNQASRQLFGTGFNGRTWDQWFRELFQQATNQPAPLLAANPNGYPGVDWARVKDTTHALPKSSSAARPFLVIDEGQDFPPQFYNSLIDLGFEHFFVVADQNQQITEANSSRRDLQKCLAIDGQDVTELKHNYRNRYTVAKLAQAFYTGERATPPPELPERRAGITPTLFVYEPKKLGSVAKRILRFADRDPRQLIGVITPNNAVRERYVERLINEDVGLDHPRPTVTTFHGEHRPNVAFSQGGILVINAQACKGLEFDTVILADIDEHYYRVDNPDATKRLFYVMVARARERVFMFTKSTKNRIDEILPDPSTLQRQEL